MTTRSSADGTWVDVMNTLDIVCKSAKTTAKHTDRLARQTKFAFGVQGKPL